MGRLRLIENPFANHGRLVEHLMEVAEAEIADPDWLPNPYTATSWRSFSQRSRIRPTG